MPLGPGLVLHFTYGRSHSRFTTAGEREDTAAANAARRS